MQLKGWDLVAGNLDGLGDMLCFDAKFNLETVLVAVANCVA